MRFALPQLIALATTAALLLGGLVGVTHFHPHSHECGCGDHSLVAFESHCPNHSDHSGHHHKAASHQCCSHSHPAANVEKAVTPGHSCCSADRHDSLTTDVAVTDRSSDQDSGHENSTPPHDHDECVICQLLAQANAVAVPTFDISLIENVSLTTFSIPVSATTTPIVRYDVRGPPVV